MKIVTIKHHRGSIWPVSVRDSDSINGKYITSIYTNEWFKSGVQSVSSRGDIWAHITEFPAKPELVGNYVAIRYNNKDFAVWRDEEVVPVGKRIFGWIKPNYLRKRFWFYPGQRPIPDNESFFMAKSKDNNRIVYTERIQRFLYENIKYVNPQFFTEEANEPNEKYPIGGQGREQFNKDFVYYLDDELFLCNDHGSEQGRVYPVPYWNEKSKEKILGNIIAAAGQFIELWEKKTYPLQRKGEWLKMKVINAQHPHLEDFGYDTHPEVWHRPSLCNSRTVKWTEPFSVFHPAGSIFALFGNNTDVAYIPASSVVILDENNPLPESFTKDWSTYPWWKPFSNGMV